jgi:RNA polymerase sigma-70 factor (ECF subfamily)
MLGRRPSVYALLALFHLQFSRFDARVGTSGELLLLEEQDRSLWNQTSLVKGFSYLELGMQAEELSTYHLEAGIAACHSAATCFQDTDWGSIVDYYEILQELNPTPVVRLNRAVAIGMKDGAKAAIEQLEGLGEISSLANYYLYPLALGEFYRRDKQWELSRVYYEKALNLVSNDSERQYLETKIESLGDCAKV